MSTIEAGFSSYATGWWMARPAPVLERAKALLKFTAELGYKRLQIACNCPLHQLSPAERADLKRGADEASIAIEVGGRRLEVELLRTYLEISREFQSPFLRWVIDGHDYEPEVNEVIQILRRIMPEFEKAGIVLAIENHDRFGAGTLSRIISEVDSKHLGICLDTANSLGAGEDVYTLVNTLGPHVVNVHLKDVSIRRVPHLQGFTVEGCVLGMGVVQLDWILAELRKYGTCRTATLEHWVSPDPDLAATIERELQWCRESSAKMRTLFPLSFSR